MGNKEVELGEKDEFRMRAKELRLFHVVQKVLGGELTQRRASELVGLSERQIRRIVRRVRREGERGVIHRGRGKPSNRRYGESLKRQVVRLYRGRYRGFGPTLANEKLRERDGIEISTQTLRQWLLAAGEWERVRRRRRHCQWRQRKSRWGEMIQMDGSHHEWFEDRGPACVLMGYIDDATNRVYARFYEYEGTLPAMDSFKRYARRYGLPHSVYLDRHTTYKSSATPTLEECLEGRRPESQFERAMRDLGVIVIHAHTPQAKGRVERLFRTFQDRVIKEMRLARIGSVCEANRWVSGYLPGYNRRFARDAPEPGDLHRRVPARVDLDSVLSIQARRVVRNDGTVSYESRFYQILESRRPRWVVVEERIDGTLRIVRDGRSLRYRAIPKPAAKPTTRKTLKAVTRAPKIPVKDHPWRSPAVLRSGSTKP